MSHLPLSASSLCDEVIDDCAARLSLTVDRPEQRLFLKSLGSVDVQAAPGCGKTCLTALKLCALSGLWSSATQGVCVLSHTNVAKDLIINLLRKDPKGSQFLRYPHFVGTIQTWVDTFLAAPSLVSEGNEILAIDDETYARFAVARLSRFPTLRGLARNRQDVAGLASTAYYEWDGSSLRVFGESNGKRVDFPTGVHTESYKQFIELKDGIARDGVFRFADMFAFGSRYLDNNPKLRQALAYRFPFVLIDEMQDTNQRQLSLLESAFPTGGVVMQRIGDVNQNLYESEASSFPSDGHQSLPRSHRFGKTLAALSSKLTMRVPQTIEGNPARPDHPPHLFLFDQDCVDKVIPEFSKVVLGLFGDDEISKFGVKVVGARKKTDSEGFPRDLRCYAKSYCPAGTGSPTSTSLFSTVEMAQQTMHVAATLADTVELLWGGIVELVKICDGRKVLGKSPTKARILHFVTKSGGTSAPIRSSIRDLLMADLSCCSSWSIAVSNLLESLSALTIGGLAKAQSYVTFGKTQPLTTQRNGQLLCFEHSGRQITVPISTIHGCKGETHLATLVVECKDGQIQDLKEVLPRLVGTETKKRWELKTVRSAAQRLFVAVSRPSSLLCFAAKIDHFNETRMHYEQAGWRVIDLTKC